MKTAWTSTEMLPPRMQLKVDGVAILLFTRILLSEGETLHADRWNTHGARFGARFVLRKYPLFVKIEDVNSFYHLQPFFCDF